jgi:sugar lactone lactonase YvrE
MCEGLDRPFHRKEWGVNAMRWNVPLPLGMCMIFLVIVFTSSAVCGETIGFDSDAWVFRDARVVEYLGRECLIGFAYLKDVELADGIVEVDVAMTGARSYPGIVFRVLSEQDHERIYIRPHRAGLYPDAIQYTPVINGIAGWQLYNGEGLTAGGQFGENEWVRLKLEFAGTQARLFVGGSNEPALVVTDLKRGVGMGSVGIQGPTDGTAYFSNFSYSAGDDLEFAQPPPVDPTCGVIAEWELSESFRLSEIDFEEYPGSEWLDGIAWQTVESGPSGLVDVALYHGRSGREPDVVFARKILHSGEDRVMKLAFGYSDYVNVFCNGRLLFTGGSAYRQRDPSFLGIVGLFDMVYLPLEKGRNELLLMVAESFGGWGFMAQNQEAVFLHPTVREIGRTGREFLFPETAIYDAERKVFYVSNYDAYRFSYTGGAQHLSKLSTVGEVIEAEWVGDLSNPTGMAWCGGKLLVVERAGIAEIDVDAGEVVSRTPIPGARFLNDIAVDSAGAAYVSDSNGHVIYRIADGSVEAWLSGDQIRQPNGLHISGGKLYIGINSDVSVKVIDLETKEIETLVRFDRGVIDGIEGSAGGELLVSLAEGKLFAVNRSGECRKLLDTTAPGFSCANFCHVPESDLLVVPTLSDNRVVLYRIGD